MVVLEERGSIEVAAIGGQTLTERGGRSVRSVGVCPLIAAQPFDAKGSAIRRGLSPYRQPAVLEGLSPYSRAASSCSAESSDIAKSMNSISSTKSSNSWRE